MSFNTLILVIRHSSSILRHRTSVLRPPTIILPILPIPPSLCSSHSPLPTSPFPLRSFVLLFPLHAPRRMVLHQTFHRVLDDVADLNMQFGCNNLHILPKMISYGSYKADF